MIFKLAIVLSKAHLFHDYLGIQIDQKKQKLENQIDTVLTNLAKNK